MRRSRLVLLIVALLPGLLAGCSTPEKRSVKEAPPVQMSLWGWIDYGSLEDQVIREAVAEFNSVNPYHTAIDYQTFNDEYKIKIAAETAANNLPDLFFAWEEGFLAPYVSSGRVLPLDGLIDTNRFIPGILDHVTFQGHVYAMPLVRTAEMVYYNRAIFSRYGIAIPRTMDELLSAVRTLRRHGVTPIALGNKDTWPGGLILDTLAYRYGGGGVFRKAAEGEIPFTAPPFANAAAAFAKLVDAGAFEPGTNNMDMDAARLAFMNGDAAMWVMGSWELDDIDAEQLADGSRSPLHGNVGFFNWPAVEHGAAAGQDAWIVSPDFNIAVSRHAANQEAAVYFLRLLASPKYQNKMAAISHLPATVVKETPSAVLPLVSELLRQLANAKDTITFPDRIMGQTTIGGAMNNSAQELLIGQKPDVTLRRLEERAQALRDQTP